MEEPKNFVELEEVTTHETESISPTRIEEELSTVEQVEGQSIKNPNGSTDPSSENPTATDEKEK